MAKARSRSGLFLLHCARRAFGRGAVTHGARAEAGSLLRSQAVAGATLGNLYPDSLIGPKGQPAAIVDAKYKILASTRERPTGVEREDLYQLTSYLSAHTRAPLASGMLAFPSFDEEVRARAERQGPWRSQLGHTVRFERLPVTADECVEVLRRLGRIRTTSEAKR